MIGLRSSRCVTRVHFCGVLTTVLLDLLNFPLPSVLKLLKKQIAKQKKRPRLQDKIIFINFVNLKTTEIDKALEADVKYRLCCVSNKSLDANVTPCFVTSHN